MRRTITTLSLAAAAVLALAACGTADQAVPAPAEPGAPAAATPSAAAATGTATTEPSTTATASHPEEHTHTQAAATTGPSPSKSASVHVEADHDDDHGGHDEIYKDVSLKEGTTSVIVSSTDQTKFRLTIESFDCKTRYPKASFTPSGTPTAFVAASGKTLCIAKVSGKNIGKIPDHAALNYLATAVDSKDKEYDETNSPRFTTQFLMDGKPALEESVDPGKTAWMVLGYEVPTAAEGVFLRIDTSPLSH